MCRMYASLGGQGPPVEELLAFRDQCTQSACGPHGDGWGIVGFGAPGSPRILGKAPARALDDKDYEEAAAQAGRCPVVLAHLRAASIGGKTLDNTQPFVLGAWAFGHNGTIAGSYAHQGPAGASDSRVLFERAHAHLAAGPVEALRAAVREVQERHVPYNSITVLLTDGKQLAMVREVREGEDEYTLRWAEVDGRLVVCQEPVLDADWQELPNGHAALATARGVAVTRL